MFLSNQYHDMPMPLIMGDWKLFIDKKAVSLKLQNIDNHGQFFAQIHNLIPGGVEVPLHGEGFWNELAKQVCFSVSTDIPNSPPPGNKITFFFNGYQMEGISTSDPASDRLWTLLGTYQVSTIGEPLQNIPQSLGLTVQDSRRQQLGWYAHITEVM